MDSQSLFQVCNARRDTRGSIPSRSDETVPVAREETSETLRLSREANPLPEHGNVGGFFLFGKKPLRSNFSDGRSLDGDSTPKRKEMHKLKFEQWPHVTRFKNWKTSFRREVIKGSTHRGQASGWLAELDPRFGRRRICILQQPDEFLKPWIPHLRNAS